MMKWNSKGDNIAIHNCLSTFHVETTLKLNGATKLNVVGSYKCVWASLCGTLPILEWLRFLES